MQGTPDTTLVDALSGCVRGAVEYFEAAGPQDLRYRVTFADGGVQAAQIPEHGSRSILGFHKWSQTDSTMGAKLDALSRCDPGLPKWLGTAFSGHMVDATTVTSWLARQALKEGGSNMIGPRVDAFLAALRDSSVDLVCRAFLRNSAPLPEAMQIAFSNGVVLRQLSDAELAAELEHHLEGPLLSWRPHIDAPNNRGVLEYRFKTPLHLNSGVAPPKDLWTSMFARIEAVQIALHCYKAGELPIDLYRLGADTSAIPLSPTTVGSATNNGFGIARYEIGEDELVGIKEFVDSCLQPTRSSLDLAKRRLRDAENRRAPVDAILDAFVGIEALLNTSKTEITLRVAMNYSTIGSRADALVRFRRLRELYGVRSKIVHGTVAKTKYSIENKERSIEEIADLCKQLLRELVRAFTADPALRVDAVLNDEFWEARYFLQAGMLRDP